jgi:hypothetical protein
MKFFLSKRDKSYLLVRDSVSKAGNVFQVTAGETWKLVWSGSVTDDFLKSPDGNGRRVRAIRANFRAVGQSRFEPRADSQKKIPAWEPQS